MVLKILLSMPKKNYCISCLYLADNGIMAEPQNVTKYFKNILRTYNEDNVCKMEFYFCLL